MEQAEKPMASHPPHHLTPYRRLQSKIFYIMDMAQVGDIKSKIFDVFMLSLISLNVVAVILETDPVLARHFHIFFRRFELFSIIVYTIEYFIRIWSCTIKEKYRHPFWGRINFIASLYAMIDLISILPFYLPLMIPLDLRTLRIVRLVRVFRVFKVGHYRRSLQVIVNVLKKSKEQLAITLMLLLLSTIVISTLMFYIENPHQPKKFVSIPVTILWCISTMATINYSDLAPITPLGKLLSIAITLIGIGLFAIPTGILSAGFADEIFRKQQQKLEGNEKALENNPTRTCPHCGKEIARQGLTE